MIGCFTYILVILVSFMMLLNHFFNFPLCQKIVLDKNLEDYPEELKYIGIFLARFDSYLRIGFKEPLYYLVCCFINLTSVFTIKLIPTEETIAEIEMARVEEDYSETSILRKVINYLQSAEAVLHFCRISILFYIFSMITFQSSLLFIWLFFKKGHFFNFCHQDKRFEVYH